MIYKSIHMGICIIAMNMISHGQCVITGSILDGETKEPLFGASVIMKPSERNAVADLWGKFVIEGICPGKYVLEIKHLGHFVHTQKVTMQDKETARLEILLTPEIKTLEGIEVKGLYYDTASQKLPYRGWTGDRYGGHPGGSVTRDTSV